MPEIRPLAAVCYAQAFAGGKGPGDISSLIAPPYDVLDANRKAAMLQRDSLNIVAIDLPFTPPKVVGPDAVYEQAGKTYRQWRDAGALASRPAPAFYVYQQNYTHRGRTFHRRGLIAGVRVQPFGKSPTPGCGGGVWPHEQTFSSGKEDRLKLMRATKAQLSPIFGIYRDPQATIAKLLAGVADRKAATFTGATATDAVGHDVWEVNDPATIATFTAALKDSDIYIADGHHRYHTALNYRNELAAAHGGDLPADHPANFVMFVLVSMEDPGMIVLPTHRVLGNLQGFSLAKLQAAAKGKLVIEPFAGSTLADLERALPTAGPHAVGLYVPSAGPRLNDRMFIAGTVGDDPLAATHAGQSEAWRKLDVAIVQHLIVEQICQPTFAQRSEAGNQSEGEVKWKFPHDLGDLAALCDGGEFQLGLVLQPTPLKSVMAVSDAGELMPQKSTFFYPKLATGLVINPLE